MPGSHAASSPSTSRAATSHLPAGILRAIALQSLLSAGETHAVGLTGDPAVGLHVVAACIAAARIQSTTGFRRSQPETGRRTGGIRPDQGSVWHLPSSSRANSPAVVSPAGGRPSVWRIRLRLLAEPTDLSDLAAPIDLARLVEAGSDFTDGQE